MAEMTEYERAQAGEIEKWKAEEPGAVNQAFGLVEHEAVLDVGCGPGQWLPVLAKHNGRVVGVDVADLLEFARRHTRDLTELPVKPRDTPRRRDCGTCKRRRRSCGRDAGEWNGPGLDEYRFHPRRAKCCPLECPWSGNRLNAVLPHHRRDRWRCPDGNHPQSPDGCTLRAHPRTLSGGRGPFA